MIDRRRFLSLSASGLGIALAAPALVGPAEARTKPFSLPKKFLPQKVRVKPGFRPGTVHIETPRHFLYLMLGDDMALRYGVAVGEEGRNLKGSARVARKVEWPSWTPTANMIRREPDKYGPLAAGMPGGPDNPLGARALYLYRGNRDTRYRIHGTPQPWTIGRSVSSGCIRMVNEHVIDLYERVPLGTTVTIY